MSQSQARRLRLAAIRLARDYARLAKEMHVDPETVKRDTKAVAGAWKAVEGGLEARSKADARQAQAGR